MVAGQARALDKSSATYISKGLFAQLNAQGNRMWEVGAYSISQTKQHTIMNLGHSLGGGGQAAWHHARRERGSTSCARAECVHVMRA
jgi:hypothetical protein